MIFFLSILLFFNRKITIANDKEKIKDREYSCDNFLLKNIHAGELEISESVKEIGNFAFCHCSKLIGPLIIPDSVEKIGSYAFYECFGFNGPLKLPKSLKK